MQVYTNMSVNILHNVMVQMLALVAYLSAAAAGPFSLRMVRRPLVQVCHASPAELRGPHFHLRFSRGFGLGVRIHAVRKVVNHPAHLISELDICDVL
jgi:hypothetical protein